MLSAQLHALRAELKAAELQYAGGIDRGAVGTGGAAGELPLDAAITQVSDSVSTVRNALLTQASSLNSRTTSGAISDDNQAPLPMPRQAVVEEVLDPLAEGSYDVGNDDVHRPPAQRPPPAPSRPRGSNAQDRRYAAADPATRGAEQSRRARRSGHPRGSQG